MRCPRKLVAEQRRARETDRRNKPETERFDSSPRPNLGLPSSSYWLCEQCRVWGYLHRNQPKTDPTQQRVSTRAQGPRRTTHFQKRSTLSRHTRQTSCLFCRIGNRKLASLESERVHSCRKPRHRQTVRLPESTNIPRSKQELRSSPRTGRSLSNKSSRRTLKIATTSWWIANNWLLISWPLISLHAFTFSRTIYYYIVTVTVDRKQFTKCLFSHLTKRTSDNELCGLIFCPKSACQHTDIVHTDIVVYVVSLCKVIGFFREERDQIRSLKYWPSYNPTTQD